MVDLVDYSTSMNAEASVCEVKPTKAPAARKVQAAAPRLRGTMQVIVNTIRGFRSSSRGEILQAAKSAGYTVADVNAALKFLTLEFVSSGESNVEAVDAHGTEARPQAFDQHEVGKRLVEELQSAEGGAWTGPELQAKFDLIFSHLTPTSQRASDRLLARCPARVSLPEVAVYAHRRTAARNPGSVGAI